MLNFHISNRALITVGVREYIQKIPFGVLETKKFYIKSIKEKPTIKSFINGGIYIIDPEVLNYIPKGEFKHITEVIEILLKEKSKVIGFPIHEYWIDVGQYNDLQKAETDFEENFLMVKALIIGSGSIVKDITEYLIIYAINVKIYSRRDKHYRDLIECLKKKKHFNPTYAVVATETSSHFKITKQLVSEKIPLILVEKPIFHKTNLDFNPKDSIVKVGYNMRFNPF